MAKILNYLLLALRAFGLRYSFHKTQEIKMILVIVKKIESDGIILAESFELETINSLQVESTGGQI